MDIITKKEISDVQEMNDVQEISDVKEIQEMNDDLSVVSQSSVPGKKYEWPDEIKKKMQEYYITTKVKYYMHLNSSSYYRFLYQMTTIPMIITSALTAILASTKIGEEQNGVDNGNGTMISVSVLSGISTIGTAVNSFLEFHTKVEIHKTVANKFASLSRFIELNVLSKTLDPVILLDKVQKEITFIQNREPIVPWYIKKQNIYSMDTDKSIHFNEEIFTIELE